MTSQHPRKLERVEQTGRDGRVCRYTRNKYREIKGSLKRRIAEGLPGARMPEGSRRTLFPRPPDRPLFTNGRGKLFYNPLRFAFVCEKGKRLLVHVNTDVVLRGCKAGSEERYRFSGQSVC